MDKGDFIDYNMDSDDDEMETTKPVTARKLVWMSTAQKVQADPVYSVTSPHATCGNLRILQQLEFSVVEWAFQIK